MKKIILVLFSGVTFGLSIIDPEPMPKPFLVSVDVVITAVNNFVVTFISI